MPSRVECAKDKLLGVYFDGHWLPYANKLHSATTIASIGFVRSAHHLCVDVVLFVEREIDRLLYRLLSSVFYGGMRIPPPGVAFL